MLKHKTVFVLGAGASIPYGFPSGAEMLREAKQLSCEDIRARTNNALHPDQEGVLREALVDTQEESLDSMLETQLAHIQAAGKRLIARRILEAEDGMRAPPTRDWFSYLFSRMTEGITGQGAGGLQDFLNRNNITFVTYNYDRLVEHKLMAGLRAKYGATQNHWPEVLGRIIHLHGSVGDISPSSLRYVPWSADFRNKKSLDFNVGAVLTWSEQSIKVVHEPKPDAQEFQRARGVLGQAERVFFLGFGFGRTNVDRLDFGCIQKQAVIRFTRHKMTDGETNLYILPPLKKAGLGNYGHSPADGDCLALLQENITALVDRY
jgi:hypothetical protein